MNAIRSPLQREAADPSTSARRLAELAIQEPSLWAVIIGNPSCDPSYREWILTQRPDLRPAAAPAAGPSAHRPESEPAAASTRTTRKRQRVLPLLAALGMLVLVFALGAGGTLWWVSRADADREPAPSAVVEDEHRTPPVESSEDAAWPDSDEASDDGGAHAVDASPAQDATPSTEREATTAAPISTPQAVDPEDRAVDGERIHGEERLVISSPSQNIGCELGETYVGCTIAERDLDTVGCPKHATASFEIVDGRSAMPACGKQYLGEVGDAVRVLEYGESISFGRSTCASESDGMTCWDDETGHSMTVSRNGVMLG